MRIALVSSELTPFAKTGGLGDVVAALAVALHRAGHDVKVFVPLYATSDKAGADFSPVERVQSVPLRLGPWEVPFSLWQAAIPGSDLPASFVHCPQLYGRAGFYTEDWDEGIRFAYLTRAALAACQHLGWSPQIFHCNDWHTALGPLFLKTSLAWDRLFVDTKTVLTIHNLGYQGIFAASLLDDLGLRNESHLFWQEDLQAGRINFLKTGIVYADLLTTVSKTYAQEIQTPEQGFGLDALLRERRGALLGIVNGIDPAEWNPEADPHLPATFSAADMAGKARCKAALLAEAGLDPTVYKPLVGVVSRLTFQKGFDLLFDTLPPLLAADELRFVALGSGETKYVDFLRWLAQRFPGRAAFHEGYSNPLAHRIEAGADAFLMPSRYEPCGLNQMYSQRYGTVPIVRKTGGLADTVEPYDRAADTGTGFVFEHFTAKGLNWALRYALWLYREDREAWTRMSKRGMERDFSWDRQVQEYVDAYRRLTG
ncbi:MAG TPA: glycogen synthase [Thermoanaerobaculia bacterium]|nr:glycogen synthase [Thermoanaerobaculia bacterium]